MFDLGAHRVALGQDRDYDAITRLLDDIRSVLSTEPRSAVAFLFRIQTTTGSVFIDQRIVRHLARRVTFRVK